MIIELNDAIPELKDILKKGNLSLFAGSGISVPSGLPTWDGLLKEFVAMADTLPISNPIHQAELKQIIADANHSFANNTADPIRIATVLKAKIHECDLMNETLALSVYTGWVHQIFGSHNTNNYHDLIVQTNYPFILTSNYDLLLEWAAIKNGFKELEVNSFSFKDELKIMSSIHNGKECIIHVHGKAAGSSTGLSIDELIFTKEDYNKMILKKYNGFSFALRMLFTRYSTLFIGYGASDPHLEEIMEEITDYFPLGNNQKYPLPKSYLIVMRSKVDSILERWKNRVRTNIIVIDDYADNELLLTELKNTEPRV